MIYITGDTHGEDNRFDYIEKTVEMNTGKKLNKDDTVIVCGDFGYVWGTEEKEKLLDSFESKEYTICFCDGNHENFDLLYSYPVEIWRGGRIHRVRKNVIHLIRGQIYDVEGKKIFAMGGGYSIDKALRREGYSWWSREMPSNEEYNEAIESLKNAGMEVDYIITHTAPLEIVMMMGKHPDVHERELNGFLDWVMHDVSYRQWFFGHWHYDMQITPKIKALLFDVVEPE